MNLSFRSSSKKENKDNAHTLQFDQNDTQHRSEKTLNCAHCQHPITMPKFKSTQSGKHLHSFMNPEGYMYEIGIFSQAEGTLKEGLPSAFFSWFDGYIWQVERCANCHLHMGWSFENEERLFYGLILSHLVMLEK